jgi:hypothetical protein
MAAEKPRVERRMDVAAPAATPPSQTSFAALASNDAIRCLAELALRPATMWRWAVIDWPLRPVPDDVHIVRMDWQARRAAGAPGQRRRGLRRAAAAPATLSTTTPQLPDKNQSGSRLG